MKTVAVLDRSLSGRSLVFGSLPPEGRDVDLLVPSDQLGAVESSLAAAGFLRSGALWASFRRWPPEIVEVVDAASWGLPQRELRSLFDEARPLPGLEWIVRPSPRHAVLILARRVARAGVLDARLRARLDLLLREDPQAFDGARKSADAWGAGRAVSLLAAAYEGGGRLGKVSRSLAVATELRARGRGPARTAAGVAAVLAGRPRRGSVIALSGLDGSGKSTQARMLAETLGDLGYRVRVEWPAIDAPSRVMAALTRLGKGSVRAASRPKGPTAVSDDPARALRQRSEAITFVWSSLYAVRGAVRAARLTWPGVVRGAVVVCDRYVLDSNVFMIHRYGAQRGYRAQLALLRLLSPRPRAAFLVEVPAAVATARQPERTLAENAERARLYRALAGRYATEPIAGDRSPEEVSLALSERVWLALTGR